MKPEAREPWRQHRNRHHLSPQTALLGVLVHQVEVGADVGAADLEHLASVRLVVEGRQQVGDHVLDRDRLCARLHPARRDHHGQPLDECAQHLERRTPRADHDRGAELDRRDARPAQDAADFLARGEVLGERRPPRARRGRRSCEHPRRAPRSRTPKPPRDQPPRRSRPTPSSARGSTPSRRPRAPRASVSGLDTSPWTTSVPGPTRAERYSGRRERQRTRSPRASSACRRRPPM